MSTAQITDLYEVSMTHSYLRERMTALATFSLCVRHLPPGRGFLVAAGLEPALDMLSGLRIDEEDVAAYASALQPAARRICGRCWGSASPATCGRCPRARSCWPASHCWR